MTDKTDERILEVLKEHGRITMKELGERVHLTGQATATRVEKLEDRGIIEGYTIQIDEKKRGRPVHAFITIFTRHTYHQPYLSFVEKSDAYVVNNYKISGDGCYILECRLASHEQLDEFLEDLNEHANYQVSLVLNHNPGRRK